MREAAVQTPRVGLGSEVARPRPAEALLLLPLPLSLALIYTVSSVPIPSREESSPLPDPARADAGINPLALESSPAPLEAIDPARLFVNREGGSPPMPRLEEQQDVLHLKVRIVSCGVGRKAENTSRSSPKRCLRDCPSKAG